jgi:hypothetical protein
MLSLMVISCSLKNRTEAIKVVTQWQGKTLRFPTTYTCGKNGEDVANAVGDSLLHKEYKILLFVDSAECTSCRFKPLEWERLMMEMDSISKNNVGFLYFFSPSDGQEKKEIQYMLHRYKMNYPVFFDEKWEMKSLNSLSDMVISQCFLLNKTNEVLLVGDPTLNPNVRLLYEQYVKELLKEGTKE